MSNPENLPSKGLIMVKPHAYDMVLDPIIKQMLEGEGVSRLLNDDDPLVAYLPDIEVDEAVRVADLTGASFGKSMIELFYGDKETRRYYPLIQRYYMGRVAFMTYTYHGEPDNLPDVYRALKGTTQTFTTSGDQIDPPSGIRGLFGEPYVLASAEEASHMSDAEYNDRFTPVVKNFIHVPDSQQEIQRALNMLADDETFPAV